MTIPKFRAWDVHEKKMFTNDQLIIWNGNVYANDNSKLNVDNLKGWNIDEKYLMQSTGLKDKNGKEIFEGDIVKYKAGCNTYTEEVAYDKDFGGFGVRDAKADIIFTFGEVFEDEVLEDIYIKPLEVIGNIYDNPELLEEE